LIEKKAKGEKIEAPKHEPSGKVINLMDALRRSVQAEKATARPAPAATRAKKGRKASGQKEMLLPIQGKKAAQAETAKVENGKTRAPAKHRKAG
jgi:DNA end-binding protein Ku